MKKNEKPALHTHVPVSALQLRDVEILFVHLPFALHFFIVYSSLHKFAKFLLFFSYLDLFVIMASQFGRPY